MILVSITLRRYPKATMNLSLSFIPLKRAKKFYPDTVDEFNFKFSHN